MTFGLVYVTVIFTALGLVAGGTVPLVLECVERLYTADLIGVGASVNTTAAGIFAGCRAAGDRLRDACRQP